MGVARFWCPLYYKYNRTPPKNGTGDYLGRYITVFDVVES